jgi:hypothetical protein
MQESRDAALYHNKLDKLLTSARERSTTKQQAKQPMPQREPRLGNKRSVHTKPTENRNSPINAHHSPH